MSHALRSLLVEQGFPDPDAWLEYAKAHQFQPVRSTRLTACPDCHAPQSSEVAAYVYYSTLMRLKRCEGCGLIYCDTRLDRDVIATHFDTTYKDEQYFTEQRRRINDHLAQTVAARCPIGCTVLDVGGAKGHVMAKLRDLRPDVRVVVNDLSPLSCAWAREHYGIEAIVGELPTLRGAYDVVVISDALYYMSDLAECWDTIRGLVKPGGWLVLRIPNKLCAIRAGLAVTSNHHRTRVRFLNIEHVSIFSRRYLRTRLRQLGFRPPRFHGSPLNGTGRLPYLAFHALRWAALTPSVLVTAQRL